MLNSRPTQSRHLTRGISLVEMMVGITVGLIVLAGALSLFAGSMSSGRRAVAESRVQQDLRTIADLVSRDLRRAGYWGNAIQGTIAIGSTSLTAENKYADVDPTVSTTDGKIEYSFSRDSTENDTLDDAEVFGFRRDASTGALEMQTSKNTWVPLNDTRYTTITAFKLTDESPAERLLGTRCTPIKLAGDPTMPKLNVRRYDLQITAQSALDATVVRTLRTTIRLRNDHVSGNC